MIAPHDAQQYITHEITALIADYARTAQRFTVVELRDQLLKVPGLEDADPVQLRYRVRDRLLTLEKHAQVQQVAVQGKRRPVYVIAPTAVETLAAQATRRPAPPASRTSEPAAPCELSETSPDSDETAAFVQFLKAERHRLKLDMQAAFGEASHYGRILEQFPEQRTRVEPLHERALHRGGELKGALDAVMTLHQSLRDQDGGA